jgi:hypothetical protein
MFRRLQQQVVANQHQWIPFIPFANPFQTTNSLKIHSSLEIRTNQPYAILRLQQQVVDNQY